jgi:two-component system, chemotaxis family, chemotaxis protein CheV
MRGGGKISGEGEISMAQTNILLETGTNEFEIVEFFIEEEGANGETYTGHYGVNVAKVLEIIRLPQITEMPEARHSCLLGAFNLRSRIVPLIDLSVWLQKQRKDSSAPKVIVTEFNYILNSFLVSGVNRIHRLSWEQVEPPDDHVSRFSSGCITGVVKFDDRIILLLDMEQIVADINPNLGLHLQEDAEDETLAGERSVKVLFADDSSMIRKTLSRGLEKAGFEVNIASDGKMAWDMLRQIKAQALDADEPLTHHLNMVISDIEMPVMDGHNLTKRIKEDPVLKQLPVILFSSLITDALRHKGESVGADDQIAKPDITTLTTRCKKLLSERQGLEF